jgi:glycerophosphoryl diester phosphodiesterase
VFDRLPIIIAHRGASAEAPENTLIAFELGIRQGCTGIELDVHLSRDGQLVVCHDSTVERTTNGVGAIADMTVSELRAFDAGSWLNERFAGERLPLLGEVFDLAPPAMPINVEIKCYGNEAVYEPLIELLRRKDRIDTVFVSCFDHDMAAELKRREPEVRIGLLYDRGKVEIDEFESRTGVSLYSLHPHHSYITRDYVEAAHRKNVCIFPWTVDPEPRMRELLAAGVDGIITNVPARLKRLLDAH